MRINQCHLLSDMNSANARPLTKVDFIYSLHVVNSEFPFVHFILCTHKMCREGIGNLIDWDLLFYFRPLFGVLSSLFCLVMSFLLLYFPFYSRIRSVLCVVRYPFNLCVFLSMSFSPLSPFLCQCLFISLSLFSSASLFYLLRSTVNH